MYLIIAPCSILTDPTNGAVSLTGNTYRDTAMFTCHSGYELVGTVTLTCEGDGSWSDEPPVCRRE